MLTIKFHIEHSRTFIFLQALEWRTQTLIQFSGVQIFGNTANGRGSNYTIVELNETEARFNHDDIRECSYRSLGDQLPQFEHDLSNVFSRRFDRPVQLFKAGSCCCARMWCVDTIIRNRMYSCCRSLPCRV